MKEQSLNLLRQAFREFYFRNGSYVETPDRIDEREFGYMHFNSGMVRHLAFRNIGELQVLLLKEIPSDVYCSSAYYASPTAPMQEKGFRGSDLIFDIDIKQLHLQCMREHEAWLCNSCGNVMPEKAGCGRCSSTKVESVSLPCDNCVGAGKKEVKKLLKILADDLGVTEKEVKTYFSGNNGFHIHIYSKDLEQLDAVARNEIADYVTGRHLLPEAFGISRNKNSLKRVLGSFPDPDDFGWRGRVAKELIGDGKEKTKVVASVLKKDYAQFRADLESIAREAGAMIDPNVTKDAHRIFRLQGTLNSKSGLTKAPCVDLESFDPFTDACLLGDAETTVHVTWAPKFVLRNNSFGPYRDQDVRLPTYAAVYLICKGLAEA